ncbi:MAG: preprotein translocase subunit SecE [Candidatus Kaiserbacteria bacterium]|nr:MAG: preprotein translocase subunit SecE [Candidatus Kaiserbacteria bacterium]
MSFIQYLKDTRSELKHVAWPTRIQTIIYTVIVIGISLFVAVYLGLFDYIFTTALSRGLQFVPASSQGIDFEGAASTSLGEITVSTSTPQE